MLNFTDGQKVDEDFVVAKMTSREQSADLAAARADAAEATKAYRTRQGSVRTGFASEAQVDAATSTRDSAAGAREGVGIAA